MNAITGSLQNEWEPASRVRMPDVGVLAECSTVAVPLKPSAMMLADGSRAGNVSVECAWRIYLAMIRQATPEAQAAAGL